MDLTLIQTILSLLGGSGLVGAGTFFYNKFRKRIIVKLVKDKHDTDLDDFILLYDEIIEDNIRIAPEEIIKFIGCHKPTPETTVCDYLFLCKKEGKVIGFLKTIYCVEKGILFIAYLGIDKQNEQARKQATFSLYYKLRKLIKSKLKNCKAIIFEVEASKLAKSNAKQRLFKNAVERFSFPCFRFDIEYFQPEMPSDEGSTQKEKTALLLVPLKKELSAKKEIDKQTMLDYLDFIYNKIYARTYDDRELNQVYKMYLDDLIKEYERTLPDKIKLC